MLYLFVCLKCPPISKPCLNALTHILAVVGNFAAVEDYVIVCPSHFYLWNTSHLSNLPAPLYRTTSKWLPAARGQSASIVLKFPGLKWGTHASPWHSNLALLPWLLLTRGNRRACDQRPFLDTVCDHFSCVCLNPDKHGPHNCFLIWFVPSFYPAAKKKVKRWKWEEWKQEKDPTWRPWDRYEPVGRFAPGTVCIYVLGICVCVCVCVFAYM